MTDTGQPDKDRAAREAKDAVRYRSMSLEMAPLPEERKDGEQETRIPVAISSETKVERYDWWTDERYYEVLDHDPKSVDLGYARDGLPFLMDHDARVQVGILEDVRVEDGKVRGMLRMGNHPDAAWVEKDIRQGVRKKVSVGYKLGEYRIEKDEYEGLPVRRYRWKPVEGSSVPIPADYEVGIGRSAHKTSKPESVVIPIRFEIDQESRPVKVKRGDVTDTGPCANDGCGHDYAEHQDDGMACQAERCVCPGYVQGGAEPQQKSQQHPSSPAPKAKERNVPEVEKRDGADPEHKPGPGSVGLNEKREEMADISRVCAAHGCAERAGDFIAQGVSLEAVKARLFDEKFQRARPVTAPGHIDLSDREMQGYSIARAFQCMLNKTWEREGGLEKEVSDEIGKRLGKATSGIYVPLTMQVRAAVTGNVAGTTSLGGAGVQTTVLTLIDILRNKMLLRQLGATVLSGLTGNITFPRQITANTMAWEGENPSTAHANTAATLDNVTLTPKTAMASSAYSRQLLVQNSFDVDQFILSDLGRVLALGLDLAGIDGLGSSNQPTGIMRQTGVNTATFTGTNGGVPTWAELVAFETEVAKDNADIGATAWVTTPGLRGKLKTVLKSTTAGSTYIWESDNTINGYPAFATNQMPSNFTAGTNTTVAHGVLFGVFSEALIGEWGGAAEFVIDPYTSAKQNMVEITAMLMADIAVRHPGAFTVNKTALLA